LSPVAAPEIAPLHRLALEQLRLAAERERRVGDEVARALGTLAVEALARARALVPLPADAVAERSGRGDASHDELRGLVAAAHRREAATWRALLETGGDDAEVRLRLAAEEHGREVGGRVAALHGGAGGGPGAALDLLAATLLEGLPCEATVHIQREEPRHVAWTHAACPYQAHWTAAGVDFAGACGILSAWIRGFASGCDPTLEYRRPAALAAGDPHCEHELTVIAP
jgi:hypothetical protein